LDVVENVLKILELDNVVVNLESDAPLGCGLGVSGACAVSTSLGLHSIFGISATLKEVGDVAHIAEVSCRTGLSDVVAQCLGGLVVRLKAGSPTRAVTDVVPVERRIVSYVVKGSIPTPEILTSSELQKIKKAGEECLKEFMKSPSLENFFSISREFSMMTELATPWVIDVFEAIDSEGGKALMAMLGECVVALGVPECLHEFGDVRTCYIGEDRVKITSKVF